MNIQTDNSEYNVIKQLFTNDYSNGHLCVKITDDSNKERLGSDSVLSDIDVNISTIVEEFECLLQIAKPSHDDENNKKIIANRNNSSIAYNNIAKHYERIDRIASARGGNSKKRPFGVFELIDNHVGDNREYSIFRLDLPINYYKPLSYYFENNKEISLDFSIWVIGKVLSTVHTSNLFPSLNLSNIIVCEDFTTVSILDWSDAIDLLEMPNDDRVNKLAGFFECILKSMPRFADEDRSEYFSFLIDIATKSHSGHPNVDFSCPFDLHETLHTKFSK